jgi:hypothetical protein
MIDLNVENRTLIKSIYVKYLDRSTVIDIDDVLTLAKLFKTYNVDIDTLRVVKPYWSFIQSVLDNILTSKWTIYPITWLECITTASETLVEYQIKEQYECYIAKHYNILESLGLSTAESEDKFLVERWLQHDAGFINMLNVANVLVEGFVALNDIFVDGSSIDKNLKVGGIPVESPLTEDEVDTNKHDLIHNLMAR